MAITLSFDDNGETTKEGDF